ncbi:MAG TPA: response regulator [Acidimicrobiales bacterium]|nr:response regulator [Acidimicrobiales bacterium]
MNTLEELSVTPVILVVDDEASGRMLARVTLESEGMRVVEAENGREALDAASEHQPDVIVLDYRLRDELNGLELAPLLRHRCERAHVVLYSAVLADDFRWHEAVDAIVDKSDALRLLRTVATLVPGRLHHAGRGVAGPVAG